jgi:hypothetical protein
MPPAAIASILFGEDLDAVRSMFPALRQALIATTHRQALDAAMDQRERRLRAEIESISARLRAIEGERLRW